MYGRYSTQCIRLAATTPNTCEWYASILLSFYLETPTIDKQFSEGLDGAVDIRPLWIHLRPAHSLVCSRQVEGGLG